MGAQNFKEKAKIIKMGIRTLWLKALRVWGKMRVRKLRVYG